MTSLTTIHLFLRSSFHLPRLFFSLNSFCWSFVSLFVAGVGRVGRCCLDVGAGSCLAQASLLNDGRINLSRDAMLCLVAMIRAPISALATGQCPGLYWVQLALVLLLVLIESIAMMSAIHRSVSPVGRRVATGCPLAAVSVRGAAVERGTLSTEAGVSKAKLAAPGVSRWATHPAVSSARQ